MLSSILVFLIIQHVHIQLIGTYYYYYYYYYYY